MTKQELLKRCETIYDMGLMNDGALTSLERGVELLMRITDVAARGTVTISADAPPQCDNQIEYARDIIAMEAARVRAAAGKGALLTLASDQPGYDAVRLAVVLTHPCQTCAEDARAFHTRPGFCEHRKAAAALSSK